MLFTNMDFLQGKKLIHKQRELVLADNALKKKVLILFYFTSGNCEACRSFDIKLKELYREAIYRRVELAIVVVSADSDKSSFVHSLKAHYEDWFAIQYDDELMGVLVYNYGVTHIPTLIVVRKNGTIVTREGKDDVEKNGINVLVTWAE